MTLVVTRAPVMRRLGHAPKRKAPGADFPGDKGVEKPVIAAPYKHSAIAQRLEAESIRRQSALSAFYSLGAAARAKGKRKVKR
ncbi:MAG TPA: hypothetical protein VGC15_14265 [Acetobacteraceae bacterium]